MAQVIFYEKPGCISNTRQKKLLRNAGHNVIAIDLLNTEWDRDTLLDYFNDLPVPLWFNKSSPRIKSGEIIIENLDQDQALQLILADPILIRRPLLKVNKEFKVGFDFAEVNQWIGLSADDDLNSDKNEFTDNEFTDTDLSDLESCSRNNLKNDSATTGEQPS